MTDIDDFITDYLKERGWRFRFHYWWMRHVRWPRQQRQWDKAVKVIRDWDYYVISDHDYYRGVKAGLWEDKDA